MTKKSISSLCDVWPDTGNESSSMDIIFSTVVTGTSSTVTLIRTIARITRSKKMREHKKTSAINKRSANTHEGHANITLDETGITIIATIDIQKKANGSGIPHILHAYKGRLF